ncbi:MAG: Band 7 protein, partial [Gammaproteobacteria bacterium]|nr:Band 7 protein [Gammaproteobacteria bacterium]
FRKNIAEGLKEAADSLKSAGVNAEFLLFLEYTDALKYVAEHSQGKVVFMDSGAGAAARIVQGVLSMGAEEPVTPLPPAPGDSLLRRKID